MLNFFKIVPCNKSIKYGSKIVSHCNNSTYKVFCNMNEVKIFWSDWECVTLQIKSLKLCCISENSDYLVLLSQKTLTNRIYMSVYNMSNQVGRKNAAFIGSSVLESSSKVTALCAFNIFESEIIFSIGLDNGNVLFYKSALQKNLPTIFFKNMNASTKSIKGIKFSKYKEKSSMFVCSDAGIYCFTICDNSIVNETKLILDDMDSSIHSITLKPSLELGGESCLVIARDDGLYCYTTEGRGPCYAINGSKHAVEWFGKYFIIVSKTRACFPLHQTTSQILVYDVDSKIIVLNKVFHEIECVLPNLGHSNCFILLKNGEIFTLREKNMNYKISHLIKKNLYDSALKILDENVANLDVISNILIQYGNYLLHRGNPSGAVIAYSKTIGTIPSYLIIKNLIDFRYNDFLVQYLSKLIQTEFKRPEHIEILNYCFLRSNLPRIANYVFEIEDSEFKQLHVDYAFKKKNGNEPLLTYNPKRKFSFNFFHQCSCTQIEQFLLEYGHYLINEYPDVIKDITQYSLSDQNRKSNIINRIILPLSLMNKPSDLKFIDKLINNCENHSIYNIMTELILHMWHTSKVDISYVIEFFKLYQPETCIDNVFVLCRHYKFWPAIKMIYDKYSMEILSTHCLAKCYELFPDYVTGYPDEYSCKNLNQIIQALNKKNYALNYIIGFGKNLFYNNPYHILNTLNSFVISRDFILSQLDELPVQEQILTYFKSDKLKTRVLFLEHKVIDMEEVVNNYLRRPIEFRNRSCDICKQLIKLPSVFFLCQHSFHKECFIQFSEVYMCIVCTDISKNVDKRNKYSAQDYEKLNNRSGSKNTILVEISKKMSQLPTKSSGKNKCFRTKNIQSKTLKKYKKLEHSYQSDDTIFFNYNEYDDNLNPFINK